MPRGGDEIMKRGWYELWEEGLERRLRRKNSRATRMAPDLLQALRKDLAEIAGCPRQVTDRGVHENPGAEEITNADRKFASEIGLNLDATLTAQPRQGRKKKKRISSVE